MGVCAISLQSQMIGLDLLGGKNEIEVPFTLKQGFIVVNIKLDNKLPLDFILDTGAEHSVLFHRAYTDLLGMPYSKRIQIRGSDLDLPQYALISRNAVINIASKAIVKRDLLVLEENLQLFQESLGFPIDGILGGSFYRGLVLNIDYKKRKLRFYNPDKFKMKRTGFTEIDIEILRNKPYITTKTSINPNSSANTKLLIDTGAGIPLLLHADTDSSLILPNIVINGTIGQGLGGNLEGFIGKVHKFEMDRFEFPEILALFQDFDDQLEENRPNKIFRNGIIGNLLLSRFEIFIDYLKEKLYLKPIGKFNKDFDYDKSGLIIFAIGKNLNQFYVKDVLPGTPAAEAGILPGDLIKRIGIFGSNFWSLERINEKLRGKDGKKIRMVIERGGYKIKKTFRLRDLFKNPSPK